MRLSMMDRNAIARAFAIEYRRARKKRKSGMLTEFLVLTGYNRYYATRLLRNIMKPKKIKTPYTAGIVP